MKDISGEVCFVVLRIQQTNGVAMMTIPSDLVKKLTRPGPRYTSYPTVPEWKEAVSSEDYAQILADFAAQKRSVSLYIHIPFCESLCSFCGCQMVVRRPEARYGDAYLDTLSQEMSLIKQALGVSLRVQQIHWGGGTPSFLTENQMARLDAEVHRFFEVEASCERAVEVDPRRVTRSKVETLRRLGFHRISIGLQDFDPDVQAAVNRIQPRSLVENFFHWCRDLSFSSVNFDLIYGLPRQTRESFSRTMRHVLALRPDRVALYSFAYVPWLKKHQRKIPLESLPSPDEKIAIFLDARQDFLNAGYTAIAMDHFAVPEDELSRAYQEGRLSRNFMGYTVLPTADFLGLGVSSISQLGAVYVQNMKALPHYTNAVTAGRLPVRIGKRLDRDDEIRRWVIHHLMCRLKIEKKLFAETFGENFDDYFHEEEAHVNQCEADGLLMRDNDGLMITPLGQIFLRNIAMGFDRYLRRPAPVEPQFSQTV